MKRQYVSKLATPDKSGVYTFKDSRGRPLYIGRATSLRDRLKSYFGNDLIETRGPRIVDMVTRATRLTFEVTDSVLEAIILESNLIKKYQPKYNVDERDDKSDLYIVITDEIWPRVFTVRTRDFQKSPFKTRDLFGPYPHGGLINESLKILRKIFPFKDKKSHDPRHEAFYKSLGRSPEGGAHDEVDGEKDKMARQQYSRTIKNLKLFLQGKKSTIVKHLERDMKTHAKNMEFEAAGQIKRTLFALKHINDIALIKKAENEMEAKAGAGSRLGSRSFRIEAYDIAHLSGSNTVGAMVVSTNGERTPSEYRKFKISRDMNNDVANLVELISRRLNHSEWAYPDLIVVDGNEMQKRAAEAVLSARRVDIPVVGVMKDERHKAREIIGHPEIAEKYKADIIALNAEAHRFTIKYHRQRRGKMFG